MKKIFDKNFIIFLMVGVINTLVSAVLMFFLEDFGYWISTSLAYLAGAVVSFFLNRYVTFKSDEDFFKSLVKFSINVALCYVIAYSLAQPIAGFALSFTKIPKIWQERFIKLFGMGLYTFINYFGQRFFAFKKRVLH